MAIYDYSIWLLCASILLIAKVQGNSIPPNGLKKDSVKKRCGEKNYGVSSSNLLSRVRRTAVENGHWADHTNVTYTITNGPFESDTHHKQFALLTKERVGELVVKAFAEWEPYCGLHFQEWSNSTGSHPNIILSFESFDHGDGTPFREPCGVSDLAHTFFPNEQGTMVHFNNAETWVERQVSYEESEACIKSFYPTVLHEIGHALGLGHTKDGDSIMYEYETLPVFSLNPTDKMNMQKLYGINETKVILS